MTTNLAAVYRLDRTPLDPDAERHLRELAAAIDAVCSEDDCDKPQRARGKCDGHYRTRILRQGRLCTNCEKGFLRAAGETVDAYLKREHCSASCRSSAAAKAQHERYRAERIEDLRWIAGTDTTERIARRLGYKDADSLLRTVARWNVPDLEAILWRDAEKVLAA